MSSGKCSASKAVPAVAVPKLNVSHIVPIRLTVPNVFLLEPSRIFPVSEERSPFRGFKSTTKTCRSHRMSHQTSIGHILLMANIRNFPDKVLTRAFSRAMFRRGNFLGLLNLVRDSVLRLDSRIIRDRGQSVLRRNVLPRFNRATS